MAAEVTETEILYCLPADLDDRAQYQEGYLVVTAQYVITVTGSRIASQHRCRPEDRYVAHVMTGSGMFLVTGTQGSRVLAYFSRQHATAYLQLAQALGTARPIGEQRPTTQAVDGLLPIQRGGFARDWVAEPLRDPRAVLVRLLAYLAPYRWTLLLILLLFMVANGLKLLIPQLTRVLIDDWLIPRKSDLRQGALLIGAMAGVYILHSAVLVWRNRRMARLSAGLVFDLRQAVHASLQRMSLRFIASKPPGDVLNRVVSDTHNLRQFLHRWGTDGASQLLLLFLLCLITFIQNWQLALLTVSTVPLAVLVAIAVWRLARWMERTHHRLNDRIGSFVHDVLAGIRVVKAFRREEAEISRYNAWTARKYVIDVRNQKIWRTMGPIVEFSMRVGELLMFLVGGALVLAGELQIGELVQFAAYVVLLVEPLAWMGQVPQRLVEALTSAERIFETLDQEPEIVSAVNPIGRKIQGDIQFDHVTFAYRPGEPVLEEFTLSIAAGEMVGLVGASGAGKSTVINLLLRLYEVDAGRIALDGIDLRAWDLTSMRRQVGVVLQDPFLFSGTVAENIRYAKPDATQAEVIQAARMAEVHEFVMRFPDGYETLVGERGQRLSGGERQRIAIARAILHDPRILILDEATSALDLETEERIHSALATLTAGRTVIAIAHRLATLRRAQRLVVIEAGRIVEHGTHRQLISASGRYRKMVEAQRQLSDARTLSLPVGG